MTSMQDPASRPGPVLRLSVPLKTGGAWPVWYFEAGERVRAEVTRILRNDRSVDGVIQAALAINEIHAAWATRLETEDFFDEVQALAGKGCGLCCQGAVLSFPLQTIASALAARFTLENALFEKIQHRTLTRRAPCPMLEDNVCQIYGWRPLVCRAYFSFDLRQCQILAFCAPQPGGSGGYGRAIDALDRAVAAGARAALADLGLDGMPQYYDTALRLLFSVDDVIERWLNGEDVFREAWVGKKE